MAATLTRVANYAVGDQQRIITDVTCDGAYPGSGGYPLTPNQLGFADLTGSVIQIQQLPSGSTAAYDYTNQKLKIFSSGNTEAGAAAAGVTASGVIYRLEVTGRYAL